MVKVVHLGESTGGYDPGLSQTGDKIQCFRANTCNQLALETNVMYNPAPNQKRGANAEETQLNVRIPYFFLIHIET